MYKNRFQMWQFTTVQRIYFQNALQELDVPKLSFTSGWIYIIYIDFLPDSPTITFYLDNLLHVTQV